MVNIVEGEERERLERVGGLKLWQVLWEIYREVFEISISINGKYYGRFI